MFFDEWHCKSETGSIFATPQPPYWKLLWPHKSGADWPICIKFGMLMLNMLITMKASKWHSVRWMQKDMLLVMTRDSVTSQLHGSAACCKAHAKINWKVENSTPCKIVTPENFSLKLCTRDYVGDDNSHANSGANRFIGGFSPRGWNMWIFLTVLYCTVMSFFSRERAQVEALDGFSRFMAHTTCFHARRCLLGVRTMSDVIWGK